MFTSKSAQYTDVKNQNISPLVGLDSLYYEHATYNTTPGVQTNYVITREAVYKHMPVQLFNSSTVTPYKFDTSTSINVAPENLQNTQKITSIPNQEKNILGLIQASTFLIEKTNIPLHGVEATRRINLSDILYNYNSKYDISEYYNTYNSRITTAYSLINRSLQHCLTTFSASIGEMDITDRITQASTNIQYISELIPYIKLNIDKQLDEYPNKIYDVADLKTLSSKNELEVNKTYTINYDSYPNKFLISLLAINSSQFSPIVSTQKLKDDNYFANSSIDKWEVKYDFENNVITYMKDEYGNEAPYDFKNIISPRTSYLFTYSINQDYSLTGNCINNVVNSTSPSVELKRSGQQSDICYNYIGQDSSNILIIGSNNTIMNNNTNTQIGGNNNYVGNNNVDIVISSDNNTIKNNNSSINIITSSHNNIIENFNNQITLKTSSNTKIYNYCTSIYSNNSNNNTFFGNNSYIQINNDSTQWPYSYTASGSTVKIADPIGDNIFYFNVAGITSRPITLNNTHNIQIYKEFGAGKIIYDYSDAYSFIFAGNVSSNLINHPVQGITQYISNDILLDKVGNSNATYSAENNEWLIDRSTTNNFYITALDSDTPITSNTGKVTIKPNTAGWNITNTYSNNTHYININPNSKTDTVTVDLLYDNIALLPNNLYITTPPRKMPPLAEWSTDKSAFCYTFRSTQYPNDKYTLDTNNIWDDGYNMKQGINSPSLNIWNVADKFPNVYISSNLFGLVEYTYTGPFGSLPVTKQAIKLLTNAKGNVKLHLYGNSVKDISKIIYSKDDGGDGKVVHEFTVGNSSLVKFKEEYTPNINGGAAYNTELDVSSSINSTAETLDITLSYNLIDRAGAHRYLGYSGNNNGQIEINMPNKLENYPKLTFKTNTGKILDSSVLLDIGTYFGEISFEVRFAFLPPNLTPSGSYNISEHHLRPIYTFSHFEYDSTTGDATYVVFTATSFDTSWYYEDNFSVIPPSATSFYNMGYQSANKNSDPHVQLQDITVASNLAYLYIPISELKSVMCDNEGSQDYIHNYDTANNVINKPVSSNGILRLDYYIRYDMHLQRPTFVPEPNINEYLMKVYYRNDDGVNVPLDYVLNFNCKQIYKRKVRTETAMTL